MNISGSTALVTGANRGLGRAFVSALLDRGARRVYATARRPESIALEPHERSRVELMRIDVTDPRRVADAAERAPDVDILVNNAGISTLTDLLTGDLGRIRDEFDVHVWGTLQMTRAFAPVLAANGGGGIIMMMSLLSFRSFPGNGAYATAKAAQWQLTNSIRLELARHGTQVTGAHLSSTATDMMAAWDIPKADPRAAVDTILDGFERGAQEVMDAETAAVKARLSQKPEELYAELNEPEAATMIAGMVRNVRENLGT